MLVQITDNVHVAADEVASVEVDHEHGVLHVEQRNGRMHRVEKVYGKSIYDTQAHIVGLVNAKPSPGTLRTISIDIRNAYEARDRDKLECSLKRLDPAGS